MPSQLPLPDFVRRLRERIRARPDTEFQQALIRFVIGVIAYLYFGFSWIEHPDFISSSIHFIALFFLSTATLILAGTLMNRRASPRRRVFGAIVDFSTASFMLMVGGGHGFQMLEDTVLIEVKQGPYTGLDEKERF